MLDSMDKLLTQETKVSDLNPQKGGLAYPGEPCKSKKDMLDEFKDLEALFNGNLAVN